MKCGNCKGSHATVADVKACYGQSAEDEANAKAEAEMESRMERFWEEGTEAQQTARFMENERERQMEFEFDAQIQQREAEQEERAYRDKMARDEALEAGRVLDQMHGAAPRELASDKQVKYAIDLLSERVWPDVVTEQDLRAMERRQVSKLIDGLKESPRRVVTAKVPDVNDWSRFKSIPAGRYALVEDKDGVVRFYQIDKPDEGRWAGRIFVKQLYGSPGQFRKERRYGAAAVSILELIADDPQGASLLFGKEAGICGVCGSPLTNEESRALGIGPICRGKMGW